MLFLLVAGLLISSGCVLLIKRSRDSLCLFGLCVSLMLECTGTLIFIAKKGGISFQMINFLFFRLQFKQWAQNLYIPLGMLGYMIALGRYLFPLFFVLMASDYSMLPMVRSNRRLKMLISVLPVISLILYYPKIFFGIIDRAPQMQDVLVQISYLWCNLYIGFGLFLVVKEFFSISIKFYRRQFGGIMVLMIGLAALYLLYCGQDPAQVYRFYSYDYFWSKGLGYLQYAASVISYLLIIIVNIAGAVTGMGGILHYTTRMMLDDREEMGLSKKYDIAKTNASMFVHGVKNQLLSNNVLHKRIEKEMQKEEPDLEQLKLWLEKLHSNNEYLLQRTENLYKSVKSSRIALHSIPLKEAVDSAVIRTHSKYPDAKINGDIPERIMILADKECFSEVLYNLLINAWEANLVQGRMNKPVECSCQEERLYIMLLIRDYGTGIEKKNIKKIFDPFYSSKNSNENWGMGLTYVQKVLKSHYCKIRVESRPGEGTSFYIMIPRYDIKEHSRRGVPIWKKQKY